ncbi:MAG: sulfatase-like hydrolase/transferase, partial [Luminiphilus sp.]
AAALGVIPPDVEMVGMQTTGDWQALGADQQRYEAKRMAVYAGMVEAMDHHIGRLVAYLKSQGQFDNTIFIFTSDNGAEASGPSDPHAFINQQQARSLGYNTYYETLGLKGSFSTISPSFASAAVSPLAYYKFYAGEGGMRVPLIVAGESLPQRGVLTDAFTFVTDITPTILSFAGVQPPDGRYGGRPVEAMIGRDLSPVLSGNAEQVYGADDAVGYELAGNAALFQGDYKIVVNRTPLGDGEWRLFNIKEDPGESKDLASSDPARLQRMLSAYERYKQDNKVLEMPVGYGHIKQLLINTLHQQWRTPVVVGLLTLLVLLPFMVAYRMRRKP